MSVSIINDWQRGRIPYFERPPKKEGDGRVQVVEEEEEVVVEEIKKEDEELVMLEDDGEESSVHGGEKY